MCLLVAGTAEERRAMHDGIDALHRGLQRFAIEQVALDELGLFCAELGAALRIAHQSADAVPTLGELLRKSAADLAGCSGDENLHVESIGSRVRRELEQTDMSSHCLPGQLGGFTIARMYASAEPRIALQPKAASAVDALLVHEQQRDLPGIAMPRPEAHLVVRFGSLSRAGLDAHALGSVPRVRRKLLRGGQRIVSARLHLGAVEAVLGVPASAIAGRVVALEDLWGEAQAQRLFERLGSAHDTAAAAAILESAIAERFATQTVHGVRTKLVLAAAARLTHESVSATALELGVSERHLRRVFRESVGVGPKTFAKLSRFRCALRAARSSGQVSWAAIAAAAGYYDQAHLIAEFRELAGVTPRALLGELRAGQAIG
jgi:AraC-like DNA-binding protein